VQQAGLGAHVFQNAESAWSVFDSRQIHAHNRQSVIAHVSLAQAHKTLFVAKWGQTVNTKLK
jgi:hypothetical protein